MKYLIAIIATVFTLALPQSASAQTTATSDAASDSNSSLVVDLATQATTLVDNRTYGSRIPTDTTIRTAPQVSAPSLGSGHPCMQNSSMGLSVIGGGISGGRGKVDYGCMFLRSGQSMAGLYFYAEKDPDACRALRQAGNIPQNYPCSPKEKRAMAEMASNRPVARPAAAVTPLKVRCETVNGKTTPYVSQAVASAYTTAQIQAACK